MNSSESTTVLQEIHRLLQPHEDVVGQLEMKSDYLSTKLGGKLFVIRVRIENDPGAHPSIAHAHVIVESEQTDLMHGQLDACVLGIDSDRQEALKNAASNWFEAAAGPIFSLFHARPVLNAEHFNGGEPWSVSGAHGFAGPLIVRFGADESIGAKLVERPLFQFAPEMAPPGIIHLTKATLNVDSHRWCRTIEVDGHAATYRDAAWNAEVPAPKQMIASRFATFHYADQPEKAAARQLLDDVIKKYVLVFARTRDMGQTRIQMMKAGQPEALVDRVDHFLTLALGRAIITGDMPIQHAVTYHRVLPSGEMLCDIPLMSEPAFARGKALAGELARSQLEVVKQLALCSAEVNAINNLLNAGGKLENCQASPFIVPDLGTTNEAFERALQMRAKQHSHPRTSKAPKTTTPWWKFW